MTLLLRGDQKQKQVLVMPPPNSEQTPRGPPATHLSLPNAVPKGKPGLSCGEKT